MDKQQLKQTIKEWVKLDEEMSMLKQHMKKINQAKKEMSARLLVIMKDQNIDEFDLNQDGKLIRQTKKTKQPLNKKTILISLSKYYDNEEDAVKVSEYILNSRQEKINETICKK